MVELIGFIGRGTELRAFAKRLEQVRTAGGTAVAVRGRRQVGKSRLVQEFCDRSKARYLYYTAIQGASPVEAVGSFLHTLRQSTVPDNPDLIPTNVSGGWSDAFAVLASALPDEPTVIVLDETPWLAEQDPLFEGVLQHAWDRQLSGRPVFLLLLGSDLHMMERLTSYDRPFYGRADNMTLMPLNLAATGQALGLSPEDTIDAHLISGGLPGVLRTWAPGTPPMDFIDQECLNPAAALFSVPAASLQAEFPVPDQSRRVLEAVGSGQRTHANIASGAGSRQRPVPSGSLTPLLRTLTQDKRVIAVEEPLSTRPGKPALYHIADTNLRLYLAVLREAHELIQRGRPEQGRQLIHLRWSSWRGQAVEPLIRESLEIAGLTGALPWDVRRVGGWWNRSFDPEIDLIGADRAPIADTVRFAGSIKWLGTPFDQHDLTALTRGALRIPGFEPGVTGLVGVSRGGFRDVEALDVTWGPQEVVGVWQP